MSRWKAAAIHLSISAVIGIVAAALFLCIWYPPPYFHAAGADELILLLAGVDLCVGPFLTLIIFRPGKKGLKLDLAIIGVIQTIAFAYGLVVVLQSRPIFLVGALDRFVLVSANEVSDSDLAQGGELRFRTRSWTGPQLVMAEMPAGDKERTDLAFSALVGRDLQNQPRYYRDFTQYGANLLKRARSLEDLHGKPNAEKLIAATLADLDISETVLRWIPLEARKSDMIMLIDIRNSQPIKALPIDPW